MTTEENVEKAQRLLGLLAAVATDLLGEPVVVETREGVEGGPFAIAMRSTEAELVFASGDFGSALGDAFRHMEMVMTTYLAEIHEEVDRIDRAGVKLDEAAQIVRLWRGGTLS